MNAIQLLATRGYYIIAPSVDATRNLRATGIHFIEDSDGHAGRDVKVDRPRHRLNPEEPARTAKQSSKPSDAVLEVVIRLGVGVSAVVDVNRHAVSVSAVKA